MARLGHNLASLLVPRAPTPPGDRPATKGHAENKDQSIQLGRLGLAQKTP